MQVVAMAGNNGWDRAFVRHARQALGQRFIRRGKLTAEIVEIFLVTCRRDGGICSPSG